MTKDVKICIRYDGIKKVPILPNRQLNKTFPFKCIINKDCPFKTNNCWGIIVMSCMLKFLLKIVWWNWKVGTENAIFETKSILDLSL